MIVAVGLTLAAKSANDPTASSHFEIARSVTPLTLVCGSAVAQNTGAPANAQSDTSKPMTNSMDKGTMDKGSMTNTTGMTKDGMAKDEMKKDTSKDGSPSGMKKDGMSK